MGTFNKFPTDDKSRNISNRDSFSAREDFIVELGARFLECLYDGILRVLFDGAAYGSDSCSR